MKTVKGVYENGKVKLLEEVNYTNTQTVFITFLDEEIHEEESIRTLSLTQPESFLTEYLQDKREDLYQDFAQNTSK